MRLIKASVLLSAALCACAAILLGVGSEGATAAVRHTPLTYDPATQSHPGACSQNTLNVAQAVSDLNANGVLGKYASLVGVHATGSALSTEMKQTLMVLTVLKTTVTANHGCTTDGIIFPSGARTLTAGETIGVALPASVRAKLCGGASEGCERKVLTEHTVFPTNCWNLDQGSVQVAVYLKKPAVKPKPKPKPKPTTKAVVKVAKPTASVSTACGTGNDGTSTVTLKNGSSAEASASFAVNGKSYGPLKPGQSATVQVALGAGTTSISVTSGGQTLVSQQLPADPCPVLAPAPSATAVLSCAAGGVVVTLSNAATATADAGFEVNGTSYGPLAPGATQQVTVAVAVGSTEAITVTSNGKTLLSGAAYSNACAASPSAFADVYCSTLGYGGGTATVQLANGASASLPASFEVTVTGNTVTGFGPTTVGPVAIGASQTLVLPVDASGNNVVITVDSGGAQLVNQTFGSCPGQE